jgi:ribose 1,5-bisphosphokinase
MDSASSEAGAKIGPGRLVLVVGPSGAGKDTLIRLVREQLGPRHDVVFPTRVVTRPSSAAEANDELSPAEFARQLANGAFALTWQAHGLDYAISRGIDTAIAQGQTVVLNVSRKVVPVARERYAAVAVAYIDAPSGIRASRLSTRGRETPDEVEGRLARAATPFEQAGSDILIWNDGPPEAAANRLYGFVVLGTPAQPLDRALE